MKRSTKLTNFLAKILKNKKEKTRTEIRNKSENIIIDFTEIKRVTKEYYKQIHAKKLDDLHQMDKFLET